MLLELNTTHKPATDLGFLLHKHPDKIQTIELSVGNAHVFYPEANEDSCTACLILYINPVDLVNVKVKRELAIKEFTLGLESLDRLVNKEPLRRIHECVFGVLALESESVDPRL